MSGILPKDKINECKEVFFKFTNNQPLMTPNQLKEALNALGADPSNEELMKIWKEIDFDNNGTIDIEEFLEIFAKKMKDPEIEDNLLDAFKNFDLFNTGYIQIDYLKKMMTSYGTQMTNSEFDNFIQVYLRTKAMEKEKKKEQSIKEEYNPYDNDHYVDYKMFVKILVS